MFIYQLVIIALSRATLGEQTLYSFYLNTFCSHTHVSLYIVCVHCCGRKRSQRRRVCVYYSRMCSLSARTHVFVVTRKRARAAEPACPIIYGGERARTESAHAPTSPTLRRHRHRCRRDRRSSEHKNGASKNVWSINACAGRVYYKWW